MATDERILKDAQYRKGLGIAWFNATNSAIEMVKIEHLMGKFDSKIKVSNKQKVGKKIKLEKITTEERIEYWRKKFLDDHKDYYANVIAQIGTAYNPVDAITRLKDTKTLEALLIVWRSLSEDERHDDAVLKVAQEERVKYNETPQ